jgi:hypothetical protein
MSNRNRIVAGITTGVAAVGIVATAGLGALAYTQDNAANQAGDSTSTTDTSSATSPEPSGSASTSGSFGYAAPSYSSHRENLNSSWGNFPTVSTGSRHSHSRSGGS